MITNLLRWLYYLLTLRPHQVIGPEDNPYLLRWHLIPRNRRFNVYLHKFLRSDDERALHDHPWWSYSIILKGWYYEVLPPADHKDMSLFWTRTLYWPRWSRIYRPAGHPHRIVLPPASGPVWTLFVTGPKVRDWGFHCPQGWIHWSDFDRRGGC